MTTFLKKLSAIVFVFFLFPAVLFSQNIKQDQFNTDKAASDDTARGNYLVKTDGTQIPGNNLKWKPGIVSKLEATIDGASYPISELRGAHLKNAYYGKVAKDQRRFRNDLAKRIVHGKLNIYIIDTYTPQNHLWYLFYSQVGEDGDIKLLEELAELKDLVSDCPAALSMLDKNNDDAKKALRKESGYLNRVVETYNNNCKVVPE